jgi:hypothetical protein
MIKTFFRMGS